MTSMPKMTLALFALTAACAAHSATHASEDLPKLAKITEPEARKTALARVPGDVKSEELEREHDRLVYSYDIKQPGKPGVEEVQVDAVTGLVVSIVHEDDATERKEHD